MYCKKCGEKNPDDAAFCRNCGFKFKDDVKKAEVIEAPVYTQNDNSNQGTGGKLSSDESWKYCCGCLILIFIIGAIASLFGL